MNILIVSQYFWPENFRINDLALALKERGHDVSVLTGMPNYPSGQLFEGYSWWKNRHDDMDGVPIYRVPLFLRRQGKGWQLALNYFSFVFFGCLLAPWYFRKQSFDVLFVYEPSPFTVGVPAMLLRRLKKAPTLFWVQDLWPESLTAAGAVHSSKVLKAVGGMVRWIYRRCDRVLVQSEAFVEPAVAAGAEPKRIEYFPNWAESFYQPIRDSDFIRLAEIPDGFCIMFAGNMGEAQSLETILNAAIALKENKNIHWVMIGDGRRRTWLESEISKFGLSDQFHFLGQKPATQMPEYFTFAEVLLVTLKNEPIFSLTIPSKVQSYLACGRPIIGALNGEGAKIIMDAEAGLAVAAEDADALANAVLDLYQRSPEERVAMGKRGRAYYDSHFEREQLLNKLETMMDDVVKEGLCES